MPPYFVPGYPIVILLACACILIKYFMRPPSSITKIRGPKSFSFMLGNMLEFQRPAGQTDFEWQSLYGDVVHFKTVLGGDQLLIADPKALQRIFSTYRYQKQHHLRAISRMLVGKGVVWADGKDHVRHRKILLPGFGDAEAKASLGIFRGCAQSMCANWMEIVSNNADSKVVLDIISWLSRATLDAIGQAAFDVRFETLQNEDQSLHKKYHNMRNDIFGRPSPQQVFLQAVALYLPTRLLEWMTDYIPHARLERAREVKKVSTEVARKLVREKAKQLLEGEGGRDIFSLLIKANMDAEAKNRLTEEELLAQMRTILIAGHETTANTIAWILLELARSPRAQSRLRTEIREMEATIQNRGDTEFTAEDFDAMPYTTAVMKEGLRYHPVAPHVYRIASRDDILPLARPISTESGEQMNEVVVPKGTPITVSIAAYNRNKELWGADAHEFNPDRWLENTEREQKVFSIGVYSNLMSFIGGTHACLGWRFAIIEIQAFLVEIFSKFELTMTERSERVCRGPLVLMAPLVEGERERGCQLPLAVSVAALEDEPSGVP